MQKKKKTRALVLSVSILILLIMVYIYNGSSQVTVNETAPKTEQSATVFDGISNFFSTKISNMQAKRELRQEERRAKKEAEAFLLQATEQVDVPIENASGESTSESSLPKENAESPVTVEEPSLQEAAEEVYVDDSSDYIPPYEISVPDNLELLEEVGEVSFKRVSDYVYAADGPMLYAGAECQGEAVRRADDWEQFLRVGISEGCCYQLVSSTGELLYADGTHFRRHREDMPLTESINLKKERVELEVDYISQFPSLTNGPEVTSLATVLRFFGYDISKDDLSENYLPKGKAGKVNFYDAYAGEPSSRNNSYGCYANAIVTTAKLYLEEKNSEYAVTDLTGSSFKDILEIVKEGLPVIVWTGKDLEEEPKFTADWIVDGEYLLWKDNMHCVVLTGYDLNAGTVIVSDPMYGIKEYELSLFIKRFKQFYSQAVVIR